VVGEGPLSLYQERKFALWVAPFFKIIQNHTKSDFFVLPFNY